ncbi:hypothetical protein DPMN_133823, partial [Dreissena polymorpha]
YVGTMLAQEGIADIHTNVGPTSNRVAFPISGRCNYRCRADIHTDVGPTLRVVALPVSGRCNYRFVCESKERQLCVKIAKKDYRKERMI